MSDRTLKSRAKPKNPDLHTVILEVGPEPVAIRVTKAMRQAIINGKIPSGTRLTEADLASHFQVSRIPVRECLRALESDGLIISKPYSGATVVDPPTAEADILFGIRIYLESATAKLAAQRVEAQASQGVPDTEWWEIRGRISKVLDTGDEALLRGDSSPLPELNILFHQLVAEQSGSPTLIQLMRQISGKIEWLYSLNVKKRGEQSWSEHREIMAHIDAGRPVKAEAAMRKHVEASRDAYFRSVNG